MTATRAPHLILLSIRAEDLLIAAAIIAALGDRPGRAHLRKLADRLDRCARICWQQQHPDDEGDNPCS